MKPFTFETSDALMERAKKVVPGGIYGHQTPLVLTKGAYPSFFARGEGSHIWDVDGNEYIDYMCSYGPIVLGHRHPKVEEAARRQMEFGNCFNAPGPVWVELAEHLV
ncbi:aminotransferase class III-fold pyridoxal phosphate-dependent enzyme, partial [Candidatus Binatus sp.]|uniref:aminotransferase class III-fold pyridoxal phosphate-dependent enzyme n=1 Tax=Candidatus Binatus sp. TaxID=2811406 RepID=UPI003C726219